MIDTALERSAEALDAIAKALRRSSASQQWKSAVEGYRGSLEPLGDGFDDEGSKLDVISRQCVSHLIAIGGQLRSAGSLIDHLQEVDDRQAWRPSGAHPARPDFGQFRIDFSTIRGNLRSDSPAFRHAVRLAVAVPASILIGSLLSLPRGYWPPVRRRGHLEARLQHPGEEGPRSDHRHHDRCDRRGRAGERVEAPPRPHGRARRDHRLIAYSSWAASFSVAIGFITAMVLILLSTSTTDTLGTAVDRLIDISLGGAIAVITYLVWPTSPRAGVGKAQSSLFLHCATTCEPWSTSSR